MLSTRMSETAVAQELAALGVPGKPQDGSSSLCLCFEGPHLSVCVFIRSRQLEKLCILCVTSLHASPTHRRAHTHTHTLRRAQRAERAAKRIQGCTANVGHRRAPLTAPQRASLRPDFRAGPRRRGPPRTPSPPASFYTWGN